MRLLRGILGTALLWAVTWGVIGILIITGLLVATDIGGTPSVDYLELLTRVVAAFGAFFGALGGVTGGIFAGLVAFAERRRSFADLSIGRLAAWGTVAGVAIPGVLMALSPPIDESPIPVFALTAALGASCAVGTLLLARRAPAIEASAGRELDEPLHGRRDAEAV
jgi:hypothetical protein